MLELITNTPFTTVIYNPTNEELPDCALFINDVVSNINVNFYRIGTTSCWSISFTPTVTGVYSLFAFGMIQLRLKCVEKSAYSILANIEDEAVGSWSWDKQTGKLTMFRQNGTVLSTYNVVDNLLISSRERI